MLYTYSWWEWFLISKYFLESLFRGDVQGRNQKFSSPVTREAEVIEILDAVDRYYTTPDPSDEGHVIRNM